MEFKNLFEAFSTDGRLAIPEGEILFEAVCWSAHPAFEGVSLKHLVTSKQTDGRFSYHLVKIDPGKEIGSHIHETQLETHEVISGSGTCQNDGAELLYQPGVISFFPAGHPHRVVADSTAFPPASRGYLFPDGQAAVFRSRSCLRPRPAYA